MLKLIKAWLEMPVEEDDGEVAGAAGTVGASRGRGRRKEPRSHHC